MRYVKDGDAVGCNFVGSLAARCRPVRVVDGRGQHWGMGRVTFGERRVLHRPFGFFDGLVIAVDRVVVHGHVLVRLAAGLEVHLAT